MFTGLGDMISRCIINKSIKLRQILGSQDFAQDFMLLIIEANINRFLLGETISNITMIAMTIPTIMTTMATATAPPFL